MKTKPSQTQQLLQAIMERYKLKDINEAWRIYRQKYEQDKELDPNTVRNAQVQNQQNRDR